MVVSTHLKRISQNIVYNSQIESLHRDRGENKICLNPPPSSKIKFNMYFEDCTTGESKDLVSHQIAKSQETVLEWNRD